TAGSEFHRPRSTLTFANQCATQHIPANSHADVTPLSRHEISGYRDVQPTEQRPAFWPCGIQGQNGRVRVCHKAKTAVCACATRPKRSCARVPQGQNGRVRVCHKAKTVVCACATRPIDASLCATGTQRSSRGGHKARNANSC